MTRPLLVVSRLKTSTGSLRASISIEQAHTRADDLAIGHNASGDISMTGTMWRLR